MLFHKRRKCSSIEWSGNAYVVTSFGLDSDIKLLDAKTQHASDALAYCRINLRKMCLVSCSFLARHSCGI